MAIAVRTYKRAMTKVAGPHADYGEWIASWQAAMTYAAQMGYPLAKGSSFWYQDVVEAFEGVTQPSIFLESFRVCNRVEISRNIITIDSFVEDFAEAAKWWPTGSGEKAAGRGSSAAPHGARSGDRESQPPLAGQDRDRRGRRRDHARGRSSYRVGREHAGRPCPVCTLRHPVERCYFVFPELQPLGFRLNPQRK